MNPGLGGKSAATSTLWAGVQILLSGETAPAHRHSPAAIRFIFQGKGAYTTVEGDQSFRGPSDLVLTPPWTWHDHGSDSAEPLLWMDGLDLPVGRDLDANFRVIRSLTASASLGSPATSSSYHRGLGMSMRMIPMRTPCCSRGKILPSCKPSDSIASRRTKPTTAISRLHENFPRRSPPGSSLMPTTHVADHVPLAPFCLTPHLSCPAGPRVAPQTTVYPSSPSCWGTGPPAITLRQLFHI
jgi:hypothetical protein